MHKLFALAALYLATAAHAAPPVIWDPGCSLGIRNLFNNSCLSSGGATSWGNVTGTLSDQTDLQTALDGKLADSGFLNNKMIITSPTGEIIESSVFDIAGDGGLKAYLTHTVPPDAGDIYPVIQRFEAEIDPDGNSTAQDHVSAFSTDVHYDRSNSGGDFDGGLSGVSSNVTHEGSGDVSQIIGRNDYMGLGNDITGGTSGNTYLWNGNIRVGSGHTADHIYAMNIGVSVQPTGTINDFTLWNIGGAFDTVGNVNADSWGFSGDIGGNYNGFNRSVTGNVGGYINMGQFNFTGDADSYNGLIINATGNTTSGATGLSVNTSGMLNNGLPSIAANINGSIQAGAQHEIQSGAGFSSINNINGLSTVTSGSPVTGTDVVANSFASLLIAEDDMAIGPIGLGWSAIGYVGQVGVTAGNTVDEVNMAISGASIPAESTNGTLTTFNLYRGVGLFSAGGTLTVPNVNLLKGDASMCSGATVSCHGVNVLDPLADNYFAGEANADKGFKLSTSGSQPTCDASNRGLMWNIQGGAGVADIFQVCQKNAADAYVWVTK